MGEALTALEARRDIARRIDAALGVLPEVTAVYVLGSVASGHVDQRSDVDISLVCDPGILSVSTRRETLCPIGSKWEFVQDRSDRYFRVSFRLLLYL